MVTLKAHILPHHDLQPPGCRGSWPYRLQKRHWQSGTGDEIKVWIGGSIVGEDELDKSQDSWVLSKLLKQYEDEHGVKIKLTYFEDEEAMVQLIANNERSNKEVPD
ncbi:hypothetical protein AO176_005237 [Escherichia coli]|uniref:Uncharacterized protein n=2 Tax=Escherichia coli TaxID=562 RepID=A0A0A1E2B7_ECOLX|nr:hypothetical protein [Escherichia coli]AIY22982.1 hypothetical protein [Escherichia coli]EFF7861770.1 hypothetical protein [Escherichia coli]EFK6983712.1 hypothetical protein [Escherichia coli]EFK7431498.1 hypothetical protein [Escherichia coli]EIG5997119.1 hypothetical protein [Escherichia coli]